MKTTAFYFGLAALLTGLAAAIYWFRSARIKLTKLGKFVEPANDPGALLHTYAHWIFDLSDNMKESAQLNKKAAILTGVSVLLGSIGSFLGT